MSATQPKIVTDSQGLLQNAWSQWMGFWFTPADPLPLGLIRILTGLMLTYTLCVWGLDLQTFFGSNGLQPVTAVESFYQGRTVLEFLHLVPDHRLLQVHCACIGVAILFTAGLLTRVTSVLAFLITVSYSQRVPVANFGLDQLLGMLCLYLAIGPSGASLSLDSLIRQRLRTRPGLSSAGVELPMARMALRLIQIHLCVIYFWAGFAKLKGDTWWTGEAMWQVIANQEYQTMDLTWMAWVPWLPYLLAHVTVAWEISFCAMVWKDRLRPIWLAIGTAVHIGIGACLGMWTFGLIMTFPYFAFSDGGRWRRRMTLFRESLQKERPTDDEAASESESSTEEVDDPWAASEPFVQEAQPAVPEAKPAYNIYEDVPTDSVLAEIPETLVAEPVDETGIPEPTVVASMTEESTEDLSSEQPQAQIVETPTPTKAQPAVVAEKASPAAEAADASLPPEPAQTASEDSTSQSVENTAQREPVSSPRVAESLVTASGEDATQALFREMMGMSAAPVRRAPTAPKRTKWPSRREAAQVASQITNNETPEEECMKPKNSSQEAEHENTMAADGTAINSDGARTDEVDYSDEGLIIDDDFVINGVSAPAGPIVYDNCQTGLLDNADHPEGNILPDGEIHIPDANMSPDSTEDRPVREEAENVFSGEAMSAPTPNEDSQQDSPDANHVLTTSKRMDRIRPKTANSLTGAPPPQVDGRVEDSVLAPETEVLLVAVHAPERNTFRTYLRRHDIPCRAAVSSENAVSVCLGMKPAAVLISGSMLNPEEILTLVDDLNDMIDAPILTLLTGAQVKLLSNDPMPAHILQYPASLRQIRAELMAILLEDGNARPRCSLRSAMMQD